MKIKLSYIKNSNIKHKRRITIFKGTENQTPEITLTPLIVMFHEISV